MICQAFHCSYCFIKHLIDGIPPLKIWVHCPFKSLISTIFKTLLKIRIFPLLGHHQDIEYLKSVWNNFHFASLNVIGDHEG